MRSSIDATVIAAAAIVLIMLGASPFNFNTSSAGEVVASIAGALVVFALVAICFAKQRLMHGAIGLFLLPIAIYGASRIGKPGSPWARRRYGNRRPDKQAKAVRRFRPDRRTERLPQGALPRPGRGWNRLTAVLRRRVRPGAVQEPLHPLRQVPVPVAQ